MPPKKTKKSNIDELELDEDDTINYNTFKQLLQKQNDVLKSYFDKSINQQVELLKSHFDKLVKDLDDRISIYLKM